VETNRHDDCSGASNRPRYKQGCNFGVSRLSTYAFGPRHCRWLAHSPQGLSVAMADAARPAKRSRTDGGPFFSLGRDTFKVPMALHAEVRPVVVFECVGTTSLPASCVVACGRSLAWHLLACASALCARLLHGVVRVCLFVFDHYHHRTSCTVLLSMQPVVSSVSVWQGVCSATCCVCMIACCTCAAPHTLSRSVAFSA
jgi:hypothetical protein